MAVQPIIPPELPWLYVLLVGQDWPQADEDALRRCAQDWTDALSGLVDIATHGNLAAQGVNYSVQAVSSDTFDAYWKRYTDGDDSYTGQLAQQCQQLAGLLLQQAEQVEFTKISIDIQIIILAIQLLWDLVIAPLTGGASMAEGMAAAGVARLTVRKFLFDLLKSVLLAAAPDAITQGIMLAEGHRSQFDWKELGQAAQMGAIGHLVGMGVGKATGSLTSGIEKQLGKEVGGFVSAGVTGALNNVATNMIVGTVNAIEDPQDTSQGTSDAKANEGQLNAIVNGAFTGMLFHGVHEATKQPAAHFTTDMGKFSGVKTGENTYTLFSTEKTLPGTDTPNPDYGKMTFATLGEDGTLSVKKPFSEAITTATSEYTIAGHDGSTRTYTEFGPDARPDVTTRISTGGHDFTGYSLLHQPGATPESWTVPKGAVVTYDREMQPVVVEHTNGSTTTYYTRHGDRPFAPAGTATQVEGGRTVYFDAGGHPITQTHLEQLVGAPTAVLAEAVPERVASHSATAEPSQAYATEDKPAGGPAARTVPPEQLDVMSLGDDAADAGRPKIRKARLGPLVRPSSAESTAEPIRAVKYGKRVPGTNPPEYELSSGSFPNAEARPKPADEVLAEIAEQGRQWRRLHEFRLQSLRDHINEVNRVRGWSIPAEEINSAAGFRNRVVTEGLLPKEKTEDLLDAANKAFFVRSSAHDWTSEKIGLLAGADFLERSDIPLIVGDLEKPGKSDQFDLVGLRRVDGRPQLVIVEAKGVSPYARSDTVSPGIANVPLGEPPVLRPVEQGTAHYLDHKLLQDARVAEALNTALRPAENLTPADVQRMVRDGAIDVRYFQVTMQHFPDGPGEWVTLPRIEEFYLGPREPASEPEHPDVLGLGSDDQDVPWWNRRAKPTDVAAMAVLADLREERYLAKLPEQPRRMLEQIRTAADESDRVVRGTLQQHLEGTRGLLAGEENYRKRSASIMEKIEKLPQPRRDEIARLMGGEPEKLLANISRDLNDLLRYTVTFPTDRYGNSVLEHLRALHADGYRLFTGDAQVSKPLFDTDGTLATGDYLKNFWRLGNRYNGLNATLVGPDGQVFEVQYHTPTSFKLKQNLTEGMYKIFSAVESDTGPSALHRVNALVELIAINDKYLTTGEPDPRFLPQGVDKFGPSKDATYDKLYAKLAGRADAEVQRAGLVTELRRLMKSGAASPGQTLLDFADFLQEHGERLTVTHETGSDLELGSQHHDVRPAAHLRPVEQLGPNHHVFELVSEDGTGHGVRVHIERTEHGHLAIYAEGPEGEELRARAGQMPAERGVANVIAHATPDGFLVNGAVVPFHEALGALGISDETRVVRLIACDAGGGEAAAALAEIIHRPVVAADTPVWITKAGEVIAASRPAGSAYLTHPPDGVWHVFHPQGGHEVPPAGDPLLPKAPPGWEGQDVPSRAAARRLDLLALSGGEPPPEGASPHAIRSIMDALRFAEQYDSKITEWYAEEQAGLAKGQDESLPSLIRRSAIRDALLARERREGLESALAQALAAPEDARAAAIRELFGAGAGTAGIARLPNEELQTLLDAAKARAGIVAVRDFGESADLAKATAQAQYELSGHDLRAWQRSGVASSHVDNLRAGHPGLTERQLNAGETGPPLRELRQRVKQARQAEQKHREKLLDQAGELLRNPDALAQLAEQLPQVQPRRLYAGAETAGRHALEQVREAAAQLNPQAWDQLLGPEAPSMPAAQQLEQLKQALREQGWKIEERKPGLAVTGKAPAFDASGGGNLIRSILGGEQLSLKRRGTESFIAEMPNGQLKVRVSLSATEQWRSHTTGVGHSIDEEIDSVNKPAKVTLIKHDVGPGQTFTVEIKATENPMVQPASAGDEHQVRSKIEVTPLHDPYGIYTPVEPVEIVESTPGSATDVPLGVTEQNSIQLTAKYAFTGPGFTLDASLSVSAKGTRSDELHPEHFSTASSLEEFLGAYAGDLKGSVAAQLKLGLSVPGTPISHSVQVGVEGAADEIARNVGSLLRRIRGQAGRGDFTIDESKVVDALATPELDEPEDLLGLGPLDPHRQAALDRVLAQFDELGVELWHDEEAVRYLRSRAAGANASTLGPDLVAVHPDYLDNVRTLAEELVHIRQTRAGAVEAGVGGSGNVIENEIEAREHLLANRGLYALTPEEIATIEFEIRHMRETGRY